MPTIHPNTRFAFCGNRGFVFNTMQNAGLNISSVAAVSGSYFSRELERKEISHTAISSRTEFLEWIRNIDFDVFVANGCPYRVPVAEFDSRHLLVNVHPSALPDLRGADPVPGALLYRRDSGATCHLMDADFDTGPIISQVTIPYTDDLDAPLLYQLSFLAEQEAFLMALERSFVPLRTQKNTADTIYYTKRPEDQEIDLDATTEQFLSCIRAFANRSQGAVMHHGTLAFRVFGASRLFNPYLLSKQDDFRENEVVFNYESHLVIYKQQGFLKLGPIVGDLESIRPGTILGRVM